MFSRKGLISLHGKWAIRAAVSPGLRRRLWQTSFREGWAGIDVGKFAGHPRLQRRPMPWAWKSLRELSPRAVCRAVPHQRRSSRGRHLTMAVGKTPMKCS